jgi:undecaprenyl diphosphate synthase
LQGHWAGGQTLVDFVQWCIEEGVEILTVYAFSTENWSRDPLEVAALMTIFAKYADSMKVESLSRNVRVRILSTGMLLI